MECFKRFRNIDSHFASKQILKGQTIGGLNVNRTNSYEMNAFTPCIDNEPLVDLIIPIEGALII